MATSGTVAQTTISIIDLIDHSILRCGVSPAKIEAENLTIAKGNLFYYLMYLANKGVNLWTIERQIIGMIPGQNSYPLAAGTVDVLNLLYRTLDVFYGTLTSSLGGTVANANDQNLLTFCQQSAPNGNISANFGGNQWVTNVGINPYGNLTLTLVWEYSFDNVTWAPVLTNAAVAMVDGQWYYYDIAAPVNAQYFRVREAGGAILAVREVVFGWNPTDLPIARNNRDDYANQPNKTFQSRIPTQFWFNRLLDSPPVVLWPTPSDPTICIVAWKHRQIQDIGDLTNTLEVPQRWYDCILANLAYRNSLDIPDVEPWRIQMLERNAQMAEEPPYDEERDKAPSYFTPNIGRYTGRRM